MRLPYLLCKYDMSDVRNAEHASEPSAHRHRSGLSRRGPWQGHIRLNEPAKSNRPASTSSNSAGSSVSSRDGMYWEVPVMVQRLCGICPVSHHLCAAKAMDIVAGVGPGHADGREDAAADALRPGLAVERAAISSTWPRPTCCSASRRRSRQRNIMGVIEAFPEVGKWAIFIRKFGQQVIAATGGRRIHPTPVRTGRRQSEPVRWRAATRCAATSIRSSNGACEALELHKSLCSRP